MIPTPYAIKMVLLSATIARYGREEGEQLFPFLRALEIYLEPPAELIVVKSFSRIRRELKNKNDADKAERARDNKEYPMQATIAYREYVNYKGSFQLAFHTSEDNPLNACLSMLLAQINYLGKRGGFIQILAPSQTCHERPAGNFIHLTAQTLEGFAFDGTLQMLDDCGPSLTFAKANIYDEAKIVLHKDRILRHIVLPYRQIRSSRNYSWYQRITY